MDIKDLLKDAKDLTDYELRRRLEALVVSNYKYKNLDKNNRKLVMDIIKKYQKYLKRGLWISPTTMRNEMYNLERNRIKLGIDDADLDDIKEILSELSK